MTTKKEEKKTPKKKPGVKKIKVEEKEAKVKIPKPKHQGAVLMTDIEVAEHRMMKSKFPSYPSFPRVMNGDHYNLKKASYNDGLLASVLRGFRKRVSNWKNANIQLMVETIGNMLEEKYSKA
jgi:hypothetical protein